MKVDLLIAPKIFTPVQIIIETREELNTITESLYNKAKYDPTKLGMIAGSMHDQITNATTK